MILFFFRSFKFGGIICMEEKIKILQVGFGFELNFGDVNECNHP